MAHRGSMRGRTAQHRNQQQAWSWEGGHTAQGTAAALGPATQDDLSRAIQLLRGRSSEDTRLNAGGTSERHERQTLEAGRPLAQEGGLTGLFWERGITFCM